jgi:flagellar motor switch protein FliN/FliY
MDQNDIDALMNGGDVPDDDGSGDGAAEASGELSQADIDAALAGQPDAEPAPSADKSSGADSFDSAGGFSQAEIDALMGGAEASAEVEASDAADDPASTPAGREDDSALDSNGRPMDDAARAMAEALEEERSATESVEQSDLPLTDVELPSFDDQEIATAGSQPISMLHDVQLHVKIELGRTRMFVEDVLRLTEGSVVELNRLAGDPVDVYVNDRLVARGEVLVLSDNFCVRVSEIVADEESHVLA